MIGRIFAGGRLVGEDLRALDRTEEADLVAEELAARPAPERKAAVELSIGIPRGSGPVQWEPLGPDAAYAGSQAGASANVAALEAELQREAADRLAAERSEAHRLEQQRLGEARREAERREAERAEEARRAAERAQAEQGEAARREFERIEAARAEERAIELPRGVGRAEHQQAIVLRGRSIELSEELVHQRAAGGLAHVAAVGGERVRFVEEQHGGFRFPRELEDLVQPLFGRTEIHVEDLVQADEAFFTSSTKELMPIVRVDDHTIGSGAPGPLTKQLLHEFRRRASQPSA